MRNAGARRTLRLVTLGISTLFTAGALACGSDDGGVAPSGDGTTNPESPIPAGGLGNGTGATAGGTSAGSASSGGSTTAGSTTSGGGSSTAGSTTSGGGGGTTAGGGGTTPSASGKWVTGYYAGYQQDIYPPSAVDFTGMSHLAVGRIIPNADGSLNTAFDTHDGPALAKTLAGLAHAAGKKAILMLGGAGAHDAWVSASSSANRATFVKNLTTALTAYGYDGYDLDWEPISASDQPSFKALATDLRAALPKAILTVPVTWESPTDAAFWKSVSPLFDQINIMSYSMADAWPGWQSWHSSALAGETSATPSSVDKSVKAYLAAGVPAAKLGLGIGFYGTCWAGGVNGPKEVVGGSRVAGSDNEFSYTNIMASYYVAASRKWDATAKAPYLSFAAAKGAKGCTFVSYEDEQSIQEKGTYAKGKGLGGAIIWTINQGYVPTASGAAKNPLLAAAKKAFLD